MDYLQYARKKTMSRTIDFSVLNLIINGLPSILLITLVKSNQYL